MGYWPNDWDNDTGHRLGPWFDGFVGTDGKTNDLYAAYVTEGWRRIVLCAGAILSADLTISANDVYIWSPFHPRSLVLGGKKITVSGSRCFLAGFKIDTASGVGIEISGDCNLERIAVRDCGSHGIDVTSTDNDMVFRDLYIRSNGGDGVKIASGATNLRISNSFIWGNTGYGVNDGDNSSILVGNRLNGNTAGQINGSPDIDVGNLKT